MWWENIKHKNENSTKPKVEIWKMLQFHFSEANNSTWTFAKCAKLIIEKEKSWQLNVFAWKLNVKINGENESKNHVKNVAIQRRKSEKYFSIDRTKYLPR